MSCHRRSFRRVAALLVLLAVLPFTAGAGEPSHLRLKKGERILFLGDSITQAGASHAKGYVNLIKKDLAEKHADLDIQVIGAGISGNKVPDLQRRLERDVLKKKPTVVVIYIGINDVWHGERDPARGTSKEKFAEGLKDIIGQIQKDGAQVLLCTPSVIGEKKSGANSLDAKLDEYAGVSRTVAKEMKVPLCDLRKHFVAHLGKHNPEDLERGILTSDRVHLNDAGNRLVADAILKCLGAEGTRR